LAFLATLGALGWAVLLAAWVVPGFAPAQPNRFEPLAFTLFLVVVIAARPMAFRLFSESVVSLDSAFYIAAALCLGSVAAGWLVVGALTCDALIRMLRHGGRRSQPERAWLRKAAHALYFGGMTGGLVTVTAWLLRVDGRHVVGNAAAQGTVVWLVPVFGVLFL